MQTNLFFLVSVLTLAGFYAILAQLLNIVAGWGGMPDLGVAGLVGVACYTYAITTQTTVDDVVLMPQWPWWGGVVAAGVVTAAAAFVIGVPTLRLRGEYFLITTLAFAEVTRQIALNAIPLTNGTVGFAQIERPFSDMFVGRDYRYFLLAVVAVVVVAVFLLARRISTSPYGRMLRATRDNESVAVSLGKQVSRNRIVLYTFVGLVLGLVAPIYLWHVRTTVPSLFSSELTFTVWTALVVGGIGSRLGPIAGAFVLILVTELFTLLQGSTENAQLLAAARPVLLGLVLILAMRLLPRGLLTEQRAFAKASGRWAMRRPPPGGRAVPVEPAEPAEVAR
ncbi:MAG: branched-chain amino acid ABC transporter permease [Actinomycetota bacterium]|nr:branched-chain amino acid ABC transporter permease [Actinomycetota bacterium]